MAARYLSDGLVGSKTRIHRRESTTSPYLAATGLPQGAGSLHIYVQFYHKIYVWRSEKRRGGKEEPHVMQKEQGQVREPRSLGL